MFVLFSNVFIRQLYLKSYDSVEGQGRRLTIKGHEMTFSVFEAFSFLLDDGMALWLTNKQ